MAVKEVIKGVRFDDGEWAKLEDLIKYAHLLGRIPEPTFAAWVKYATDCAFTRLKEEELKRRGFE